MLRAKRLFPERIIGRLNRLKVLSLPVEALKTSRMPCTSSTWRYTVHCICRFCRISAARAAPTSFDLR